MPILARVGRRSWKDARARSRLCTVALGMGAITMLYPLILMVSGSVRSDTDFRWVTPMPEYLFDDRVLWMKYVESKYGLFPMRKPRGIRMIVSWRNISAAKHQWGRVTAVWRGRRVSPNESWPSEWYGWVTCDVREAGAATDPGAKYTRFRGQTGEVRDVDDIFGSSGRCVIPHGRTSARRWSIYAERRFTFPQEPAAYAFYDVKWILRLNILKSMELIARMKVSGTMEIGRKYMIDLTRPPASSQVHKQTYALTINGATTTAIIVADY